MHIDTAVNKDLPLGFHLGKVVGFLASAGSSIVPLPARKGGKSKGARGRGRKTVSRTRDER